MTTTDYLAQFDYIKLLYMYLFIFFALNIISLN